MLLKAWLRGRRAYYVSRHPHLRHPRHATPIGTAGKRRLDQQEALEQNHPWSPQLQDLRVRFPAGAGSAGTCLVGEGTGDVRAALRVAPRRLRWWPVPSPAAGRALFGVTFLTPPKDSTGISHIMEHSVLCGSRKYTSKEPFAELLKGSLQTFLNAFTYPGPARGHAYLFDVVEMFCGRKQF